MNRDKQSSSTSLLQYMSAIIASILPIAQLFLTSLPSTIKDSFISQKYITGVSIITLIFTYMLIIAYQTKPYFVLQLPFQGKAKKNYSKYLNDINSINALKTTYMDSLKATEISNKLKALKVVYPPKNISLDNLLSICIFTIFICSISFIVLAQMSHESVVLGVLQSISYVLLIASSALVLTVYRHTTQNSKNHNENQRTRTSRAIELATFANCFGDLPQVKYISSYDDANYTMGFHVMVEYKNNKYEITTDGEGKKLLSVYKIEPRHKN